MRALSILLLTIISISFVPGEGGGPVESYRVCTGQTPGSYPTCEDVGSGTPATIDGQPGLKVTIDRDLSKVHYAVVKAVNSFGESPASNEVTLGKPSAPVVKAASASTSPGQ